MNPDLPVDLQGRLVILSYSVFSVIFHSVPPGGP